MNTRFSLFAILCTVLLHSGAFAERPNFVVIFTDDQGYQDVGCFGSPDIRTPRLDQMAEQGMRFTSFYAQPICGPSRAALVTGCYPTRQEYTRIAVEALQAGGANRAEARQLVADSLRNLREQGVRLPTNIPWN